ncbi:helix-turn-helix transcriptional regulator [Streptomyces mauvecolor]
MVRALAKLEQALPVRLRRQVTAIQSTAAPLPVPWSTGSTDAPSTLATLAAACREHETLTFTYRRGSGKTGRRRVEPHTLVAADPVWYLIAYDTEHAKWRLPRRPPHRPHPHRTPRPTA